MSGLAWTTFNSDSQNTGPAPEVVRASMPTTTFFFDDAVDALAAHFTKDVSLSGATDSPDAMAGSYGTDQTSLSKDSELLGAPTPGDSVTDAAFENLAPLVNNPDKSKTVTLSPLVDHPSLAAVRSNADAPEGALQTVVAVAPGNTLSGILNDHGVNMDQMPKLLTDDLVKQYLSNLNIGQELEITQLPDGEFHSLRTRVGDDKRITIRRSANDFAVASIDLPIEKERVVTSGTIEQSLYLAAAEANLKQSTIMELADIFQWELDFAKDIRKGDQFSLVYDRLVSRRQLYRRRRHSCCRIHPRRQDSPCNTLYDR